MVTLENKQIKIVVNPHGAELWSIIKDGRERLWQGDPDIWDGRAYNLFPICGGLKDNEYFYNGRPYHMKKHGFARHAEFKVERQSDDEAAFLLSSDFYKDDGYPFLYDFRVFYKLLGGTVRVTYSIKNKGDADMYFSCGAHEGYSLNGPIEDYSLYFSDDTELFRYVLDGDILTNVREPLYMKGNEMPLNYTYFDTDAIVLKDHKSKKVQLKNRKSGECVTVCFDDFRYLLFWTKRNGGYLCIEPWTGIPDTECADKKIEHKEGITRLAAGAETEFVHTFTIDGEL